MRLVRTEYWNPNTGTVRTGSTGHGESLADMETYLLPLSAELAAGALGSGVMQGLEVTATVGTPGLTVGTGLALDGEGRPVLLSEDGAVVVDPNAPPVDQVQNVLLDLVGSGGAGLATSGLTGAQVLTLTAREVLDPTAGASSWGLVHAPWLRLVAQASFTDDGSSVPLAVATLDASGAVIALEAGPRRHASPAVGSLTLLRTSVVGGQTPSVRAVTGPSLRTRQDGGLDVVLPGPLAGAALSVEGTTGNLLTGGNVGIGTGTDPLTKRLHVNGSLHSGGADAGLSFMDRHAAGYVDTPTTGQRWVWYADGGYARLWSGTDQLCVGEPGDGGGLDVPRRMRVRQGGDASAGIWFFQNAAPDAAFVGLSDDSHVGLWGRGVGWGLTMNTSSGAVSTQAGLSVGTGTQANLLVSGDVTVGHNLNGVLATRHVNGKLVNNDGLDDLYLNWNTGKGVHVGGTPASTLAVHGPAVVDGNLRASGGVTLPSGGTILGEGRLHITGGEILFLLNTQGVIIGKEWGGSGNLVVEGRQLLCAGAAPPPAWSGGGVCTFDLFAGGGLYVGTDFANPACRFYSNGTKHFVIDHPLDPENRSLNHVCIEGPEAAVYYRGSGRLVDGRAVVELPEYFEALTRVDDRTVMLTAVSEEDEPVAGLAASPIRDGRFVVRAADQSNPRQRFHWEVKAVRADVDRVVVESVKRGRELVSAGVGGDGDGDGSSEGKDS
ncbi:MAG: hypothetical protein L0H96_17885 [Humibacillus sp.]|uniref:hypothetical protein n=1 Tax=Intrasporangium sp. TaxID=1925024 RepID=UPI00264716CE|nr:hypothetical protein [Intrasporangium sp.]MDN5768115.1 hypothetical protein [Humibacillus sp.]MDN5778769.1 hypothetical protein [Humibacillus sp.]MDN5795391.1 hypothetical protein [Intrasporangium sp.]